MRIAIGADHLGATCCLAIWHWLATRYEFENFGAVSDTEVVDYVPIAKEVSTKVASGEFEKGILICGSGIGMSICANKVKGVRAALCRDAYDASMSRRHNNANILCLGGRQTSPEDAVRIVGVWLNEKFEGGAHQERLAGITELERTP